MARLPAARARLRRVPRLRVRVAHDRASHLIWEKPPVFDLQDGASANRAPADARPHLTEPSRGTRPTRSARAARARPQAVPPPRGTRSTRRRSRPRTRRAAATTPPTPELTAAARRAVAEGGTAERAAALGALLLVDRAVARVFGALDARGMAESLVWIQTSDNGGDTAHGAANFPLRGTKCSTFEGGVRVPAFVWVGAALGRERGLRATAGTTYDGLVHVTDCADHRRRPAVGAAAPRATARAAEPAAAPTPPAAAPRRSARGRAVRARSLARAAARRGGGAGARRGRDRPAVRAGADAASNWGASAALRTARWKAIPSAHCSVADPRAAQASACGAASFLYDPEADQHETRNAPPTAPAAVVDEMRARLAAAWARLARAPAGPTAAQRRLALAAADAARPDNASELFLAPWIDEPLDALPPPPNASLVAFLHSDAAPAKLPLPDLHLGCYYTDAGEIAAKS